MPPCEVALGYLVVFSVAGAAIFYHERWIAVILVIGFLIARLLTQSRS